MWVIAVLAGFFLGFLIALDGAHSPPTTNDHPVINAGYDIRNYDDDDNDETLEDVSVSGIDKEYVLTKDTDTLAVSCISCRVIITSGVHVNEIVLSGNRNLLKIENGASFGEMSISGVDNVVCIPDGLRVDISDSGVNTQITHSC